MATILSLRRKIFCRATALAVSVLAVTSGCGGGSGGEQTPAPLPGILRSNVAVLPGDGSVSIANADAGSVTLTGNVPALAPGQVLMSTQGEGLLRKVVSVAPDGAGGTVLQTENATLEDAFQQADVRVDRELLPSDFAVTTATMPDVIVEPARSRADDTSSEFKLTLVKTVLEGTKTRGLLLEGTVTLKFAIKNNVLIKEGRVESFTYIPTTSVKTQLKLTSNLKLGTASAKRVQIAKFIGNPIFVPVGPPPAGVIFVPALDVYLAFEGGIEGGVEVNPNSTVTFQSGVTYTRVGGFAPVSGGSIDASLGTLSQTNAYLSFKATVGPQPELALRLFGVVGPYVKAYTPFLEAEHRRQVSTVTSQNGLLVKYGVGTKATVGVNATFSKDLIKEYPDVVDLRRNFYDKFFPDNANAKIGVQ